jgi:gluconolactonase
VSVFDEALQDTDMLYSLQEVRRFTSGLDHPEGVAVGRDGAVYAGGEGGQVYRISPEGRETEVLASTGGFCLGITLDLQENIYICDSGKRAIFRVNQNGNLDVFADRANDHRLIQPNFSVFDSKGNLYFSDSGEWKKMNGLVYRALPDGKVSVFSEGPFHFPNGLALDANEQYLYVI